MTNQTDPWDGGEPYEVFMGRWSNRMAPVFIDWLNLPDGLSWLDLGCGTGALSAAILERCHPVRLDCVDPSADFIEKAKVQTSGLANYHVGSASAIPLPDRACACIVSGLALNFFPDLPAALSEIQRVVRPGGTIAAYVWDYAGRMEMLRFFWDAACALDPDAVTLDEGHRFPICNADRLQAAFEEAGLFDVRTTALDIHADFRNFDDYWNPFLGGQGPAGGYLATVAPDLREAIRTNLQQNLSPHPHQPFRLLARSIAVRGTHRT